MNYTSSSYNTGWMHGDIKGAWLSDTTQETVVSTELVTNGTFDSNTNGWTGIGATVTWNAGRISIATDTSQWSGAYTTVQVVSGKTYIITGTIVDTGGGWAGISGSYVGPNSGVKAFNGAYPAAQSWTFNHTATQSGTLYITIDHSNTTSANTILADNISVRIADVDRSVNNKGLQVFGNITKTPVATGADLVAYSGFNTTAGYSPNGNRLQQPYNSGYNFTGDFSISYWVKGNDSDTAIHWSDASGNDGWHIYHNANTSYFLDGTWDSYSAYQQVNSVSSLTGAWTKVDYIRRGGYLYYYLNGVLKGTYNSIGGWALTSTTAHQLAVYAGNTTNAFALLRISATAPSEEQIAKIYRDEKVLFQENAKATLYGTSDAVTALAYEDTNEILHVGTSSGRSDFQGLRRINNTTTAVATAISANKGMVVEQ